MATGTDGSARAAPTPATAMNATGSRTRNRILAQRRIGAP
jgi:hypothetical protein